ncbi:MAG: nucleotidyltransferase family protein [Sphingobacteriaceae bacterium]|nr:MAG: nucleotidyltransferase family protein [Sphingobacteriaceae bacterium]
MIGLIILAAGSSSRLGKPKQNLVFQGSTLLQRSIKAALDSDCQQVVVVLGANLSVIEPTIKNEPVQIIHNLDWEKGMSSSISSGLAALLKTNTQLQSVILMLCDQPFADTSIINQLIQASANNKPLVACNYNGTIGVPALFYKSYFNELLALQGNEGAKKLLLKYSNDLHTVPFPLGMIDIDTIGDFERLEISGN